MLFGYRACDDLLPRHNHPLQPQLRIPSLLPAMRMASNLFLGRIGIESSLFGCHSVFLTIKANIGSET